MGRFCKRIVDAAYRVMIVAGGHYHRGGRQHSRRGSWCGRHNARVGWLRNSFVHDACRQAEERDEIKRPIGLPLYIA
jgi:hypothetical protein